MLSYEIIRNSSYPVSEWSGGTTTQIYIYPKDADYGKRVFDFRISSAKVLLEQSDFTPLIGFERYIMPLEGEMYLEHEGHHNKMLKPFEQDYFSGDWHTKSAGKCTDFNLMLACGYEGSITCINPNRVTLCSTKKHTGFFILADETIVLIKKNDDEILTETLNKSDFIMFPANEHNIKYTVVLKSALGHCGIAGIQAIAVKDD